MQIEIVNVDVENKGKYQMAEVTFKSEGKTQSKKVVSFGTSEKVFKVLGAATKGQHYEITMVKGEKYWEWTDAAPVQATAGKAAPSGTGIPSPKSTYETPEERAKRQIYIVRQSSIGHALEFLKNKEGVIEEDISELLAVAAQFEDFVFNGLVGNGSDLTSDKPWEDDIPL